MSASLDTLQGTAGFKTEVMRDLTDTDRQILVARVTPYGRSWKIILRTKREDWDICTL